jgi:hypothetical protein
MDQGLLIGLDRGDIGDPSFWSALNSVSDQVLCLEIVVCQQLSTKDNCNSCEKTQITHIFAA